MAVSCCGFGSLARSLAFRFIPTHPVAPILIVEKLRQLTPEGGVVCLKLVVNVGDQFRLFRRRETGDFTFQFCQTHGYPFVSTPSKFKSTFATEVHAAASAALRFSGNGPSGSVASFFASVSRSR